MKSKMGKRLLTAMGVLAFLGLIIAAFIYFAVNGLGTRPATAAEKRLLVTIDDLSYYADIPGDRNICESLLVRQNIDGTETVEYVYDSALDSKTADFIYLSSSAEINSSIRSAKESFSITVPAMKVGASLGGGGDFKFEEDSSLFSLGDESFASRIRMDGDYIGNMLVIRNGKNIHELTLMGVYFDDKSDLESLLYPSLQ